MKERRDRAIQALRRLVPNLRTVRIGFLTSIPFLFFPLTLVMYNVQGKDDNAKVTASQMSIKGVENAIELYKLDVGAYPTMIDDLLVSPSTTVPWSGPYLRGSRVPRDAWGNELIFRRPGAGGSDHDVISLGRDGAHGGQGFDQDIVGSGH